MKKISVFIFGIFCFVSFCSPAKAERTTVECTYRLIGTASDQSGSKYGWFGSPYQEDYNYFYKEEGPFDFTILFAPDGSMGFSKIPNASLVSPIIGDPLNPLSSESFVDDSLGNYDCSKTHQRLFLTYSHHNTSGNKLQYVLTSSKLDDTSNEFYLANQIVDPAKLPTGVGGEETCAGMIQNSSFGALLLEVELFIKILAPVILIVLSVIDFVKAIASQDQDEIKKASMNFVKRISITVLIFLSTTFVYFLLNFFNIQSCLP